MEERTYGRHDLVNAYAEVGADEPGGAEPAPVTYRAASRAYHLAIRDGLAKLFELPLTGSGPAEHTALFMLFRSTVASLRGQQTPWSGFLEASLLHRRLEEAGEAGARAGAASDRILARYRENRADHLVILDALVTVFLGDRADRTFTAADLRAVGVDVRKPLITDFDLDDEDW